MFRRRKDLLDLRGHVLRVEPGHVWNGIAPAVHVADKIGLYIA
jgi:hypothetical protein